MKLVIIESPYAGDVEGNLTYLRACIAECLSRGEAPFASHAIYTQPGVLRDDVPEERTLGIEAGFAWAEPAGEIAFYVDKGWSNGMKSAWIRHVRAGALVSIRKLGKPLSWATYTKETAPFWPWRTSAEKADDREFLQGVTHAFPPVPAARSGEHFFLEFVPQKDFVIRELAFREYGHHYRVRRVEVGNVLKNDPDYLFTGDCLPHLRIGGRHKAGTPIRVEVECLQQIPSHVPHHLLFAFLYHLLDNGESSG